MAKKAFNKIATGLKDVLADVRGEPGHVTRVTLVGTKKEFEAWQYGVRCAAEWAGRVSPKAKKAILANLAAELEAANGGSSAGKMK